MALHLGNLTFDCDDPQKMVAFWSAAMDLPADEGVPPFFASLGLGDPEVSPNWLFLKVPEGKTAKNRVHIDLGADDRAAEVARLIELGATHVEDKEEWGHAWAVMADVEGNEFCVAQV